MGRRRSDIDEPLLDVREMALLLGALSRIETLSAQPYSSVRPTVSSRQFISVSPVQ